ncbi:MAG: hypothetical protein ACUZ8E_13725 [Candidatus Anammoxibacter sp.]
MKRTTHGFLNIECRTSAGTSPCRWVRGMLCVATNPAARGRACTTDGFFKIEQ